MVVDDGIMCGCGLARGRSRRPRRTTSRFARRVSAGCALLTALAAAGTLHAEMPELGGRAWVEQFTIVSGFADDPWSMEVNPGGGDRFASSELYFANDPAPFSGYLRAAGPDLRFLYDDGGYRADALAIWVEADADTFLLVNDPFAEWYGNDDWTRTPGGGLNPAVIVPGPEFGRFDIWIGTIGEDTVETATLYISEVYRPFDAP